MITPVYNKKQVCTPARERTQSHTYLAHSRPTLRNVITRHRHQQFAQEGNGIWMQMVIERMLCYCADAFQGRWHGLVATSVLHGRCAVAERVAFATFPVEGGGAAGVKQTKLLLHLSRKRKFWQVPKSCQNGMVGQRQYFCYTNGQPTKLEPHPSFLRKGMHHLSPIPGWFPTSLLWCTKISVNKYIHMKNATGQPTKLEPHPSFLGRKSVHHLSPIPRWIPPSLPWCTRIYTYQYTCPSSYNNNLTTRGGEGKGGGRKKDPWTPMDTHGYPWMSMDVNRLPWGCKINAGWAIQDSFF